MPGTVVGARDRMVEKNIHGEETDNYTNVKILTLVLWKTETRCCQNLYWDTWFIRRSGKLSW